jgi:hypothetical protein
LRSWAAHRIECLQGQRSRRLEVADHHKVKKGGDTSPISLVRVAAGCFLNASEQVLVMLPAAHCFVWR